MSERTLDTRLVARVNGDERRVVEIAAARRGQSFSDFVRSAVLREAATVAAASLAGRHRSG